MSPAGFPEWKVATRVGTATFRGPPTSDDPFGPVVIVVPGARTPSEVPEALSQRLAGTCTTYVAPLAGGLTSYRHVAILSRALHRAFLGRPVVLAGFDEAASIVAQCYAPELLRAVVVDPLLRGPDGEDLRPTFGGRRAPLDIVAPPSGGPDIEARSWLRAQPNVTLFEAAAGDAAEWSRRLEAAVAWAKTIAREPAFLADRLAAATPQTARRIRFCGPGIQAFTQAYARFNPDGEVGGDLAAYDVLALVAADPDSPALAAQLSTLAPGGSVVALTPLGAAGGRLEATLVAQGLSLSSSEAALTPLGARLVRARKAQAVAPVEIEFVSYAPTLMDIRTRLPTNGLRTDLDLDLDLHLPPFDQEPGPPRIVILQRAPNGSPAGWRDLAARAILAGQVIVAEFDDHLDLTSLMTRGRRATPDEWEQFRVAHAVQTSTSQLLPVYRALNPEVRVFPNSVYELPPFPQAERPQRVFYGAISRGPFAVEVARSLAPAIEAFPHIEFHVVGDRDVFDALPTARKRFDRLMPYDQYLAAMAACCLSLSPLAEADMVDTKSDAKYLDAARAGVVTIASPILYERVIRHGENGLLAPTLADWPRRLADALADPARLRRMARAAWEDVRANRMFSRQIPERRDWYRDLLDRREMLNQALLERSPMVADALARLRQRGVTGL